MGVSPIPYSWKQVRAEHFFLLPNNPGSENIVTLQWRIKKRRCYAILLRWSPLWPDSFPYSFLHLFFIVLTSYKGLNTWVLKSHFSKVLIAKYPPYWSKVVAGVQQCFNFDSTQAHTDILFYILIVLPQSINTWLSTVLHKLWFVFVIHLWQTRLLNY